MAEWWQSPAYNARAAAGLVQTPGLIDMGGIYDAIQAPYWQRQDREQGNAVADPISLYARSNYVAQPRFASQSTAQDPISIYAKSNYTAQPRFASASSVPSLPNQPAGSIRTAKDQSRLSSGPAGWDPTYGYSPIPQTPQALAAIDGATAKTGLQQVPYGVYMNNRSRDSVEYARQGRSDLMKMLERQKGDGIIDLTASNPSDRGAQGIADSQGAPVRVGDKVYYPGGKAPVGAPQARNAPAQQQRSGGLGGLFGSIFGGGNPVNITVPGGSSSSIGNSPSQGQAMVVAPGTASGSVLSGMGFSDGALVPAATVRNLESRGYFK